MLKARPSDPLGKSCLSINVATLLITPTGPHRSLFGATVKIIRYLRSMASLNILNIEGAAPMPSFLCHVCRENIVVFCIGFMHKGEHPDLFLDNCPG